RLPRRAASAQRRGLRPAGGLACGRCAAPARVETAARWALPGRAGLVAAPQQPDLAGRRDRLGHGPAKRNVDPAGAVDPQIRPAVIVGRCTLAARPNEEMHPWMST